MPYIYPIYREALDPHIKRLAEEINELGSLEAGAGLVNYSCTQLVLELLKLSGRDFSYSQLALFSGVFHNIADEFYRRKGADYEDQKVEENGDLNWN